MKKRAVMIKGVIAGETYKIDFKPWMEEDLKKLPTDVQKECFKRIESLKTLPKAMLLHGKCDGWYSEHFHNDRFRIIIEPILNSDEKLEKMTIWAVGKRDKGYVYNLIQKRRKQNNA